MALEALFMAQNPIHFDVLIAGGGPAGLSALLWCADLDLRAILIEKEEEPGGQLLYTYNEIKNYLGIDAANGRELRDKFLRQIERANCVLRTCSKIVSADLAKKSLTLENHLEYSAGAVIIATGVRRRKLMVPGEAEFKGLGVLRSGVQQLDETLGKTVVIVGGGDAAIENALILSQNAQKIFVVHRRSDLTARNDFIERAKDSGKIEFVPDAKITAILGKEKVELVELEHLNTKERSRLETDAVLVRIGVEPNTELFREQLSLDEKGYIRINDHCSTNLPNVYACGDVANPVAPTIAAAVGHGATAAKVIRRILGLTTVA